MEIQQVSPGQSVNPAILIAVLPVTDNGRTYFRTMNA